MATTLYIDISANFSFRATVYSHGWCERAPFSVDGDRGRLSYVFSDERSAVPGTVYEEKGKLRVDLANRKIKPEKIFREVRHILRFDDVLNHFYDAAKGTGRRSW